MEPIYRQTITIRSQDTDCFGRMKSTALLSYIQEVSGHHSALLGFPWEALLERHLFWAVVRHRVQIARIPTTGKPLPWKPGPVPPPGWPIPGP